MFHDLHPARCFRGFRRAAGAPPANALATEAMEAYRLAGYAEGHLNGLPADLAALRSQVQGLAIRVEGAMSNSHGPVAGDVQRAVRACRRAAQDAWVSRSAPAGIVSASVVATHVRSLADALGNLHAALEEAGTAPGAR